MMYFQPASPAFVNIFQDVYKRQDEGKPYATYTEAMCRKMADLVSLGDIVTPNLTEACILTGRPYRKDGWTRKELEQLGRDILSLGPRAVVITCLLYTSRCV